MPRAATDSRHSGAAAEAAACEHLRQRGLALVERNARFPFGEIDLVMREGGTLAFVEVRFRRSDAFGGAAVSVNAGKRRRIALAAQAWLTANPPLAKLACRFDVVAVTPDRDDRLRCEWIPSAFTLDDLA